MFNITIFSPLSITSRVASQSHRRCINQCLHKRNMGMSKVLSYRKARKVGEEEPSIPLVKQESDRERKRRFYQAGSGMNCR
jgi:hypothetical protein